MIIAVFSVICTTLVGHKMDGLIAFQLLGIKDLGKKNNKNKNDLDKRKYE
jgi:hypothetical protein